MVQHPDWSNLDLKYGDVLGPAMKITTEREAAEYFAALITYMMRFELREARYEGRPPKTREEIVAIQKSNLGYFAGYYDNETMLRVNRLFRTVHPVFGGVPPTTPSESFALGEQWAAGKGKKQKQPEGEPKATRVRSLILD